MKKTICIALAVLLLASLTAPAFALTTDGEITEDGVVFDCPHAGVRLTLPPEFEEHEGVVLNTAAHKLQDRELYNVSFLYFGLSAEEWEELLTLGDLKWDRTITEEQAKRYDDLDRQSAFLPGLLCSEDEGEIEAFRLYAEEAGAPFGELTKIGEANGYSYFYYEEGDTRIADLRPEFAEEARKIAADIKEAAMKAEFFAPTEPEEPEDPWSGKELRFETTDLDGNPVRSEELFAQHKVTMLNIWATWCDPCKRELRELGEINRRVQEKNGAIIGILSDADDAETIALGKELLAENGADYLNLTLPAALDELGIIGGYPTSIFVDSNGVILAPPILGAAVSLYETRFSELMEGKQPAAVDAGAKDASADTAENSGGAYRVIVQDQDGNPVQGVTVQFCSKAECVLGKTDADGAASFDMPEGPGHEIHLLKVPEGFEKDGTTYSAPETYGDIVLVLNKAA